MSKGLSRELLIEEINLVIEKYKDYVKDINKVSYLENKKPNKFKTKEPSVEELLNKDINRYPVIEDKEIFDSLYFVYKKIKNYLDSKTEDNSDELRYYMNDIKSKLLIPNIRYVIKEAKKYESSGMEIYDLISEGEIGLIRAFEKYNPEKGFFITHAKLWIKGGIKRTIEEKLRMISVPIRKQKEITNINKSKENIEATLHRKPTIKELSNFTNLPVERISEIKNYDKNVISLDSKGDNPDSLLDFYNYIKDERYNFEEKLANCDLVEKLFRGIKMTEKERKILWDNIAIGKTLKEIGEYYNLTKERVRQIRNKTIKKIIVHNEKINTLEKLGMRLR